MNALLLYDPICIPNEDGDFIFIDPSSIIYVEAQDKYCNIYCDNKVTYKLVSLTMLEVHSRLPRRMFYKIHKSFIVSRWHIRGMNKKKTVLHCVNNVNLSIGRAYLPDFLKRFRM